MRNWITLFENNDDWFDAKTIDELARIKEVFLNEPGVDIDEGNLGDELPDFDVDDPEFLAKYFDHCIETFRLGFRSGKMRVYRAISVNSIEKFISTLGRYPLGRHWTYDDGAASTSYHSEAPKKHIIMLVGEVTEADVDWPSSMQQHFSHPYEHEICVDGNVRLLWINDDTTGETIAEPNVTVKA